MLIGWYKNDARISWKKEMLNICINFDFFEIFEILLFKLLHMTLNIVVYLNEHCMRIRICLGSISAIFSGVYWKYQPLGYYLNYYLCHFSFSLNSFFICIIFFSINNYSIMTRVWICRFGMLWVKLVHTFKGKAFCDTWANWQ